MMPVPELIRLNIPFIILVFLFFIAVGFTFWQYKNTVPKLSRFKKSLLMVLRFGVWFLLLLLFFKPQFLLSFLKAEQVKNALYVDQSLSISQDGKSAEEKQAILDLQKIAGPSVKMFGFNNRVWEMDADSITNGRGPTNFSSLFKHINTSHFDNILILSDGYITEGPIPQYLNQTRVRLFTIGLGHNTNQPDIFVDQVQVPPTAYAHTKQAVLVRIGIKQLKRDTTIALRLSSGGNVLSEKKISLIHGKNVFREIPFRMEAAAPGIKRYSITLDTLQNESNTDNNNRQFVQRVLKKKLSIQILGGMVSLDGKFLYEILKQNPDFDVNYLVEKRGGGFLYSGKKEINSNADVYVLINFPGPYTTAHTLQRIQNSKSGKLILLAGTNQIDLLPPLIGNKAFSGIKRFSTPRVLASFQIPDGSTLSVFSQPDLNQRFWNTLPPITSYFQLPVPLGNRMKNWVVSQGIPVISSHTGKGTKWILMNGSGFWRWHFWLQDKNELSDGYGYLVEKMVRWLAIRKKLQPIVLEADRITGKVGQPLRLKIYFYDNAYKPVTNGNVQIEVKSGIRKTLLDAVPTDSSGCYSATFTPEKPGKHHFMARGYVQGSLAGKDLLDMEVLQVEKEWLHTGQNKVYLQKLAKDNRGIYVTTAGVDSLASFFNDSGKIKKEIRRIELWQKAFFLFLILLLVSGEWILRKRFGLA